MNKFINETREMVFKNGAACIFMQVHQTTIKRLDFGVSHLFMYAFYGQWPISSESGLFIIYSVVDSVADNFQSSTSLFFHLKRSGSADILSLSLVIHFNQPTRRL